MPERILEPAVEGAAVAVACGAEHAVVGLPELIGVVVVGKLALGVEGLHHHTAICALHWGRGELTVVLCLAMRHACRVRREPLLR